MRYLLLLVFQVTLVFGHGELDGQIAKISSQIAASPNDPKLWLTRADLHHSHRDPKAALADLRQAARIKPHHPPAFLKLAQFERKFGRPSLATKALETYFGLQTNPDPQAHREKALLSAPNDAIEPWRLYLKSSVPAAMHDYALAAQTALDAKDLETTREFLKAGLNHFPKSIQLHHLRTHVLLAGLDLKSAKNTFQTLKLLHQNLLVKLNYEESLIWAHYDHPGLSRQALVSALKAYQQLPIRLQENRDLKELALKIKTTLRK